MSTTDADHPVSHALSSLLEEASSAAENKVDAERKREAEEIKENSETPHIDKNNLEGLFEKWMNPGLSDDIRKLILLNADGRTLATGVNPSSKHDNNLANSQLILPRLIQAAIESRNLSDLQRQYLQTKRVQKKILEKTLTVRQAIFETRPSITQNVTHSRLEAMALGYSLKETNYVNWDQEHVEALKEGFQFESICNLDSAQVKGLRLGLSSEQIQSPDLFQKLALLDIEKNKIDQAEAKIEAEIKEARDNEDKARADLGASGGDVNASQNALLEKREAEDKDRKETAKNNRKQKLIAYFEQINSLTEEQLQGLIDGRFTVDEVRQPWFSSHAIQALGMDIDKSELGSFKTKIEAVHIEALNLGYSPSDLHGLHSWQLGLMVNKDLNLGRPQALKVKSEQQSGAMLEFSRGLRQHNVDIDAMLAANPTRNQIWALSLGLKLQEANTLQSYQLQLMSQGLTQTQVLKITSAAQGSFIQGNFSNFQKKNILDEVLDSGWGWEYNDALQNFDPKEICELNKYQVVLIGSDLTPQQALKVTSLEQVEAIRGYMTKIKEKKANIKVSIDEVLEHQLDSAQILLVSGGASLQEAKDPKYIRHSNFLYEGYTFQEICELKEEYQLFLIKKPTSLTPQQALKVTSLEQAEAIRGYMTKIKEKKANIKVSIDEVLEHQLNMGQIYLVSAGASLLEARDPKYREHFRGLHEGGYTFSEIKSLEPFHFQRMWECRQLSLGPGRLAMLKSEPQLDAAIYLIKQGQKFEDFISRLLQLSDTQARAVSKGFEFSMVTQLQDYALQALLSKDTITVEQISQPWFTPIHGLYLALGIEYSTLASKKLEDLQKDLMTLNPFRKEESKRSEQGDFQSPRSTASAPPAIIFSQSALVPVNLPSSNLSRNGNSATAVPNNNDVAATLPVGGKKKRKKKKHKHK